MIAGCGARLTEVTSQQLPGVDVRADDQAGDRVLAPASARRQVRLEDVGDPLAVPGTPQGEHLREIWKAVLEREHSDDHVSRLLIVVEEDADRAGDVAGPDRIAKLVEFLAHPLPDVRRKQPTLVAKMIGERGTADPRCARELGEGELVVPPRGQCLVDRVQDPLACEPYAVCAGAEVIGALLS